MKRLTAYYKEWFPAPSYTDNIKLEQDQYTQQLTAYRTSEMNSTCNVLIHIQVLQLVQIELFLILCRYGYNVEAIRSAVWRRWQTRYRWRYLDRTRAFLLCLIQIHVIIVCRYKKNQCAFSCIVCDYVLSFRSLIFAIV